MLLRTLPYPEPERLATVSTVYRADASKWGEPGADRRRVLELDSARTLREE